MLRGECQRIECTRDGCQRLKIEADGLHERGDSYRKCLNHDRRGTRLDHHQHLKPLQ